MSAPTVEQIKAYVLQSVQIGVCQSIHYFLPRSESSQELAALKVNREFLKTGALYDLAEKVAHEIADQLPVVIVEEVPAVGSITKFAAGRAR